MRLFNTVNKLLTSPRFFIQKGGLIRLYSYYYLPEMQRRLFTMLAAENFDLIFVDDFVMLPYVLGLKIPKVVEVRAASKVAQESVGPEGKLSSRLVGLLNSYVIRSAYESRYRDFDACITVGSYDAEVLKSYLPGLNIHIIPYGVDTDYFKPIEAESDFPSLIFLGTFDDAKNVNDALYFYSTIYPMIRQQIPEIVLYLVGKNPPKEIESLSLDKSVVVTGYVEDTRTYVARSSVFISPIRVAAGIKTRILEAMAMGKPIVATPAGVRGVNVVSEENVIVASNSQEFAIKTIELLRHQGLRRRLGANARKTVEAYYSWENITDMLDELFHQVGREG